MTNVYCREEMSLTEKEKEVFADYLKQQELSLNIWDVFNEWVVRSTPKVKFIYLKVFQNDELIGLGLFIKIKPFDMRTSYSALRKYALLSKLFSVISTLSNDCVYISFRNLITSNITRPFFYRTPEMESTTMKAILTYLKEKKEADMVSVLDTSINDGHYEMAGFNKFPSSSEAWLDVPKYQNVSEYLNEHRNLKRNLKRSKSDIEKVIQHGPISDIDKGQMKDCVDCSVRESKINTPTQKFFEDNIFETEVFNSGKYIHVCIRVDKVIAGFHIFHVSGSIMGGVLGGFNRKYSKNNFVYERVIVASLDYAIKNKISRVHYSVIDNYTKLRLVDSLEPCGLYFYSSNPLNRNVFKATFKYSDLYNLYLLEKEGL